MELNQHSEKKLPHVSIGVGENMTERRLFFERPKYDELMQPIVRRLLSDELSIADVSDVQSEEGRTESWITVTTRDSSDWMAPAVYRGNTLVNGAYTNKTDLVREAVRFSLTALEGAQELDSL